MCVSAVPVMEEYQEQGFGCIHHVIVLFSKQKADPAAEVSYLHQLDTVALQKDTQTLQIPIHLCGTVPTCCETKQSGVNTDLTAQTKGNQREEK